MTGSVTNLEFEFLNELAIAKWQILHKILQITYPEIKDSSFYDNDSGTVKKKGKARLWREGRVRQKSIIAFWDNPIYPPRQIEGYWVTLWSW